MADIKVDHEELRNYCQNIEQYLDANRAYFQHITTSGAPRVSDAYDEETQSLVDECNSLFQQRWGELQEHVTTHVQQVQLHRDHVAGYAQTVAGNEEQAAAGFKY